jgi:uncharacterized protein YfiM (DUF2279 family)
LLQASPSAVIGVAALLAAGVAAVFASGRSGDHAEVRASSLALAGAGR